MIEFAVRRDFEQHDPQTEVCVTLRAMTNEKCQMRNEK